MGISRIYKNNIEIINYYIEWGIAQNRKQEGCKMLKKVVLGTILTLSVASICAAGPLTDYSQGKTSLDLTYKPSSDLEIEGFSIDGKSANFDVGFTAGLGNKTAIQYRFGTADSKSYSYTGDLYGYSVDGSAKTTLDAHELNVLYQLDKNVSAFVGFTSTRVGGKVSGTVDGIAGSESVKTTNNGFQVGFVGTAELADKLNAYGVVGVGNKITNYEVGLSYEVAKNTELNLGYRNTKYKNLEVSAYGYTTPEFSYKTEGLTLGVTMRF